MNIIYEFGSTIIAVVSSLLPEMLKAVHRLYDAFESLRDEIIASGFGIPVAIVSAIGVVSLFVRVFFWVAEELA